MCFFTGTVVPTRHVVIVVAVVSLDHLLSIFVTNYFFPLIPRKQSLYQYPPILKFEFQPNNSACVYLCTTKQQFIFYCKQTMKWASGKIILLYCLDSGKEIKIMKGSYTAETTILILLTIYFVASEEDVQFRFPEYDYLASTKHVRWTAMKTLFRFHHSVLSHGNKAHVPLAHTELTYRDGRFLINRPFS